MFQVEFNLMTAGKFSEGGKTFKLGPPGGYLHDASHQALHISVLYLSSFISLIRAK